MKGRDSLAEYHLYEAVAAQPSFPEARRALGQLLQAQGRFGEAIALADSIIAYYPNSRTPETYRVKAFALERKGDAAGAYDTMKQAVAVDYASATDYYQIARLYFSPADPKKTASSGSKAPWKRAWISASHPMIPRSQTRPAGMKYRRCFATMA